MKKIYIIILLLLALDKVEAQLYCKSAFSDIDWSVGIVQVDKNIYELQAIAHLSPGWYIYSTENGRFADKATNIVLRKQRSYAPLDTACLVEGTELARYDMLGKYIVYTDRIVISQPIHKKGPLPATVHGYVAYKVFRGEFPYTITDTLKFDITIE